MRGKKVAILESRLGRQLADLVAQRGGVPFHAPALAELPDLDPEAIGALVRSLEERPAKAAVFQTGVGTKALFSATDALGLTAKLLELVSRMVVAVRGPKPTAALRARGVRIDRSAADPFTTREVLECMKDVPVRGERVIVQRYGVVNVELDKALEARGASVIEIPTYRWSLPADTRPLAELIGALERADQLGERPRVRGQRPAVGRDLDDARAARFERLVQLDVDHAVALHDHALAAHRDVFHAFENLAGRERIGGAAVDAHAARAQRRGRLRAAHGDDHARNELEQLRREAERVGRADQRLGADAGLEYRRFRRPLLERAQQGADRRGIEVRQLGERRRVERHAAALRHQIGELRAETALEDRDFLTPHARSAPDALVGELQAIDDVAHHRARQLQLRPQAHLLERRRGELGE